MNNNNNNNTNGFSPAIANVYNNPSPNLTPANQGGLIPPTGDYFLVSDTGTYLIAADGTYLISNH